MVPWPRRLRVRFGGETVADTRGAHPPAPARLPARLLAAARRRAQSICWSRATGRRSRRTAARRPTGTCAWASAWPRVPSGRTPSRARGLARHARVSLVRLPLDGRLVRGGGAHLRPRARPVPARRCAPQLAKRRVEVGGVQVADTRRPVLLDETGLITRYYIPLADVREELLEPSETFTECPYKGRCDYWSVRTGDGPCRRRRLVLPPAAARRLRHRRAPLLLAGARGHRDPHRRRGPAAAARRHPAATAPRRCLRGAPVMSCRRRRACAASRPARLQRDRARPNNRAEGPPDGVMDMAHERAGGPRLWRY